MFGVFVLLIDFQCVYRIRCRFLCIGMVFFTFLGKDPRSVNSLRTNYFLCLGWDLGGLFAPLTTTPIPGVNVKAPFRGKFMETNDFKIIFVKQIEQIVLKRLRLVAFVGWDYITAGI